MVPDSPQVVGEVAPHALLTAFDELFLQIYVGGIYLMIGCVLIKKRFSQASISPIFGLDRSRRLRNDVGWTSNSAVTIFFSAACLLKGARFMPIDDTIWVSSRAWWLIDWLWSIDRLCVIFSHLIEPSRWRESISFTSDLSLILRSCSVTQGMTVPIRAYL